MSAYQQQVSVSLAQTGSKLGAVAGSLRQRMYAANAAGDYEKAKAADAVYQDCIYLAMRLGRIQIAAIDQSDEMIEALKAIKAVNKDLTAEKKRVADLKKKLDSTVGIIENVGKAVNKLTTLIS